MIGMHVHLLEMRHAALVHHHVREPHRLVVGERHPEAPSTPRHSQLELGRRLAEYG